MTRNSDWDLTEPRKRSFKLEHHRGDTDYGFISLDTSAGFLADLVKSQMIGRAVPRGKTAITIEIVVDFADPGSPVESVVVKGLADVHH